MPNPFLTGARMGIEVTYDAWIGRKKAALRRPKLDCGHVKAEDVFFHIWCDRLSCSPECAEMVHDCSEFKGKSSIEEEAVEPEAEGCAIESTDRCTCSETPAPLRLSPESYQALYGDPVAFGVDISSDGWVSVATVDSNGHFHVEQVAHPVDAALEPNPDEPQDQRPFLTAALDAERDVFAERVAAVLDELVEGLEPLGRAVTAAEAHGFKPAPARLPWWKRWLP